MLPPPPPPPLPLPLPSPTTTTTKYHLDIAEYPVASLVKIVADLLESIIETNDKLIITNNDSVTHFHSRAVPNIGIYPYLTRILKFASFSNEVLLSLLVYFDRIAKLKKTEYAVNSLTVHRLLITSIVVASKFTSDVFYPNTRYAKVGGLPLCELNQLELEFLFLCNFDLYVKLEDMQAYGDQLLTHALTQQCCTLSSCSTTVVTTTNYKIASSLSSSVSSPPLSPAISTASPSSSPSPLNTPNASKRRKRSRENDDDDISPRPTTKIATSSSTSSSEQTFIPTTRSTSSNSSNITTTSQNNTKTLLCNKLYSSYSSSHHHLDTILSTYTHDC